jgi:hypothetical protein
MFMEMEGFIKARKRDKNDQNAIIRKLRNQVEDAEKRAFYNTRAVENISTTVRSTLEIDDGSSLWSWRLSR